MRKRYGWLYGGALLLCGCALVIIGSALLGVPVIVVPSWTLLALAWVVAGVWVIGCVVALASIR